MESSQIFRLLRQALRNCQLYPEGSPVRAQAAERLHAALLEASAERPDGVSLAFLEEGVFVDGRAVLSEVEESGPPLSRQIFELGVRELRFLPGLPAAECVTFLDLLARALQGLLNPVDEDLSVLLWESDLTHVSYLLYEESGLADELSSAASIRADNGNATETDEATALGLYEDDQRLADYVDQELSIGGDHPGSWTARLTEAERLRILGAYRQEVAEELPFKYGRLLLEVVAEETDAAEENRILEVLHEYLEALASLGRFSLLQRLESELLGSENVPLRSAPTLEKVRGWFASAELPLRALQAGQIYQLDQAAALERIRKAGAAVVPELTAELAKAEGSLLPGADQVIRERLRTDSEAQMACLSSARPPVLRVLLEEAPTLPIQGLRPLREQLHEPDPAVRRQAVRALARVPGEGARHALIEVLGDADETVRIAAAEALALAGGSRALEPLLRTLVSKTFGRRSLEEKRAFFLAAGRSAPQEVLPVLSHLVEQRPLFPSHSRRERSQAALEALAQLGGEAQSYLEQRWRKRRRDLLQRLDTVSSGLGRASETQQTDPLEIPVVAPEPVDQAGREVA